MRKSRFFLTPPAKRDNVSRLIAFFVKIFTDKRGRRLIQGNADFVYFVKEPRNASFEARAVPK